MKKALKIIGWTLLGIVLAVVITVSVACYLIFTPERLTPIARKVADAYITCEHEIGQVDLTFLSTFPRFGLRADGLLLVNPKAGAQNDTVVAAQTLTVTVDVKQFFAHRNLCIYEAVLDSAIVNFYIAPDGSTNLTGVFVSSPDTVEDTSAFALPFDALRVDGLRLHADHVTFVDDKDTVSASLGATVLTAKAESWEDMLVALEASEVCAVVADETYADKLHVELVVPMAMDIDPMHFAFKNAHLTVNDYTVRFGGTLDLQEDINMDMAVQTGEWQISPFLALMPASVQELLDDIDVDGKLQLDAKAKGTYNEFSMPRIQAHVLLKEAKGAYRPLPYTFREVEMDAEADLCLDKGGKSNIRINDLKAKTKESALVAKGRVSDLMGNMGLNLNLDIDANITDFAYFMPEQLLLEGKVKGKADVVTALDDLKSLKMEKTKINADLTLTNLRYALDSMLALLPYTRAGIQIPNAAPTRPAVNWARVNLLTEKCDFAILGNFTTRLKQSDILLEASNVFSASPMLYAAAALQTKQPFKLEMDTIGLTVDAPQMTAYTEYNTKDTAVMPVVKATLNCNALNGFFNDIKVDLKRTSIEAAISGGRIDKSAPRLKAKLNTDGLQTSIGKELESKTNSLTIEASARYNEKEENLLLQWNPRLQVQLKDGILKLPERLPEPAIVPSIDFTYSNREMAVNDARITLGNSDLNLSGSVRNIGKWFRHEDIMEGTLDVVSNHCDANQLMKWFSADSGSEEKPEPKQDTVQTEEKKDTDPFLVPTDVNLALNTHVRVMEIFNQTATNLRGGLFLKDGTLILDEVGFVCRAAKLQLTAMYRTPRRNHIYLGLDYHMLDIDIEELISMIPDIDSMMPMLKSFKGAAEFHLAAETYLNSRYEPKMSTLRGAASLSGQNLVVLDGQTFSKISKLLLFNKKTENIIDSLNAEMTIYKNEIDIYPLCVQMDNYMVALGGRHNTNMTFDYDINVLKPIYLGVNVSGDIDNLRIKLAKCKYARDFRPHWNQKVDSQSMELRRRIRQSMVKNVRIQ